MNRNGVQFSLVGEAPNVGNVCMHGNQLVKKLLIIILEPLPTKVGQTGHVRKMVIKISIGIS